MGRRGTKPSITEHDGSPRHELVVMEPIGASVEPPEHLPDDVRQAWAEIAGPMHAAGLLDRADAPALEAAARCIARWRLAESVLDREGLLVDSHGGRPHPLIAVSVKAQAEFRAWSSRLGLTPVDRVSMGLAALRGKSLEQELTTKIGPSPRKA